MDLRYSNTLSLNRFVRAITAHIRCELGEALKSEYKSDNPKRAFLATWGAKIALTLSAEEISQFDPSLKSVNSLGLFTISAGAHLGTSASREMSFTYFIPFRELLDDPSPRGSNNQAVPCRVHESDPIAGDLQIAQTLSAGLQVWDGKYTLSETLAQGGTWDTISHHVTFKVETSASVTPSWIITRVTLNPSGTLFGAGRKHTDELVITMGPAILKDKKVIAAPSSALENAFQIERLRSVINPHR
jgi:hypothetical protein